MKFATLDQRIRCLEEAVFVAVDNGPKGTHVMQHGHLFRVVLTVGLTPVGGKQDLGPAAPGLHQKVS